MSGHLKVWVFGIVLIFVVVSVLTSQKKLIAMTKNEIHLTRAIMGESFNSPLVGDANRADAGLLRMARASRSQEYLMTHRSQAYPVLGHLAGHLSALAERKGAVLFYGICYRSALLWEYWVVPGLILFGATLTDALARRRIFAARSVPPQIVGFDISRHGGIAGLGMLLVYIILPWPVYGVLPFFVPPAAALALCAAAYGAIVTLPARPVK